MATSTTTCADCSGGHAQDLCITQRRRGVLLINLGTPDHHDTKSVRRYLTQFLSDPYVIKLPRRWRWLNYPLARMIAQFRGPKSAHAYRKIWTQRGSPLKFITEDQVAALKIHLPNDWEVFYAMRYANPSIGPVLQHVVDTGITDLVVIPMYPQYSGPTIGTALEQLYQSLAALGLQLNIEVRNTWYDDAGYIDAQARLIYKHIQARNLTPDNTFLLYSTHSLPQSYIKAGDPYEGQVRRSVKLVNQRLGWPTDRSRLSFQSKLGPVPWLEPSTETTVRELAEQGEKRVLVCPISFTADCLETIEEVGMTYARQFAQSGGELLLCPSLNTFEPFIKALSALARRGSHPINSNIVQVTPLLNEPVDMPDFAATVKSLTMIGVSMPSCLNGRIGPDMRHVTAEEFRRIKRPQFDTLQMLQTIKRENGFRECWLWNTCNRFEFYGFRTDEHDDLTVTSVSRQLFSDHDTDLPVNVLHGDEALHHMLRTASGLNSSLPGDCEVLEQLASAHRMARHAQTAGMSTDQLMEHVDSIAHELRHSTPWGQYTCQYCFAALRDIATTLRPTLPNAKVAVIGGSTTSLSILRTLVESFDVPSENLTIVYRGQGRQRLIKLLRRAIGQGRRLLVHKYSEPAVTDVIAEADVLFLGIDRKEPILKAQQLADLRDYTARPLTIIDFNTFGSTQDVTTINGIRVIDAVQLEAQVDRFAQSLLMQSEIHQAALDADRAILAHIESIASNSAQFASAMIEVNESAIVEGGSHAHSARG